MIAWLAWGLSTLGGALMLVAALGVLRMSDVFRRLHCSTKSATLGVMLTLVGAAVHIGTPGAWARAGAAALFFLLTAPIGGHALGRAAWRRGLGGAIDSEPTPPSSGREGDER